jgi:hypothetical protein
MTLEELAKELYKAKKQEEEAKELRISIEEAIAEQVATTDRGSKTVVAGDLKITVKRDISYSADIDAIRNDSSIPEKLKPLILKPSSYEFKAANYEALREKNPEVFTRIAAYVTTSPKKVAVSLKL